MLAFCSRFSGSLDIQEILQMRKGSKMAKITVEMNRNLSSVLDELAERQGSTKAAVIRRSLTLMKLIEEQEAEGYKLGLSKNGHLEREILIP